MSEAQSTKSIIITIQKRPPNHKFDNLFIVYIDLLGLSVS